MWIDTHCHPFAKPYNADREVVLQRAREAGIEQMIVVGFNQETNRAALELAGGAPDLWATLGVHPCDCAELTDEELAWMEEEARKNPRVLAIGEMGLDYHHMSFSKDEQELCFRKQIRLAKALDLPCIVHSRDAAEETLAILQEEQAKKVIFHCYSYGADFAKKVWELNYFTSFSGILTYPQAKEVQETARIAPEELILVETDCPYLPPQSVRGKRNEMAHLPETAAFLAELRGVSKEHLSECLRKNVKSVFQKLHI